MSRGRDRCRGRGRPRGYRRIAAAAGACLALVLVACGNDGTTLRAPAEGASAPPPPTVATSGSGQQIGPAGSSTTASLALSSPAFAADAAIPVAHTCDGQNLSPPLAWGATPAGTVELALTVVDPDANGFVHWVIAGIDPAVQAFGEGAVPEGAIQATNDKGSIGWTGPCPPKGAPHHYVFTLHALTAPSGLVDGEPGKEAIAKLAAMPGTVAVLTGTYQRAG